MRRAPVVIVPYSPEWPERFEGERAMLAGVFGPQFGIEHIGSTSVPGLGGKPIIDVMVGARAITEVEERIPAIEALGYRYLSHYEARIPSRRFFVRSAGVHVHAVELGDPFWSEHLRFRDALRADPGLAAAYFALKGELALRFRDDRDAYTEGKGPFIRDVLDRSRARGTREARRGEG